MEKMKKKVNSKLSNGKFLLSLHDFLCYNTYFLRFKDECNYEDSLIA